MSNFMNVPLYLTFFRIVMSPMFLMLYLYSESLDVPSIVAPYILLSIFTICELSDLFDGMVARKHNKVTNLGKVLDPMADSFFRLTVFLSFTQGVVQLPLIFVVIFLLRDCVVNILRMLCALKGIVLGARLSGKIKAVIQAMTGFVILILMVLCSHEYVTPLLLQKISLYIVAFAAFYSLISGAEYIGAHWKFIKQNVLY
jgi:CDP-diacylglycerol---glycerol-3-phosphate 3-phosphatidyltransferase